MLCGGRCHRSLLLLIALIVFACQAALTAWWLREHRYGRAEHLLRWFTNWQRPTECPRKACPVNCPVRGPYVRHSLTESTSSRTP